MLSVHSPEPISSEPQHAPESPVEPVHAASEDNATGGRIRKGIVLLVTLLAVGFAAWKIHANLTEAPAAPTGKRSSASGGSDRAVPVTTVAVQQMPMPIYLTGLGTVTPYNSVVIKSRVDGQLTRVAVREGQSVRKGQLLAEIDPAPYAAALAQAEGQLARDKATAAYASAEAARYTNLYNAGVVSQDSQETQVAAAGQIAGALQADNAAIQAAKVNLAYTRILSPIDGVVGLRQVDPGNIVHAADATGLLLVTQLQPIAVIFTVPEDQLPQIEDPLHKGDKLVVEAYDRSQANLLAKGKLLTVDNQIDTTTGTDKVKAVFDNKDGVLFPNQFVNARLILRTRPDAIVIPSAAVQTGTQGNFVYVLKKGEPPKSGEGDAAAGSGTGGHHGKDASAAPGAGAAAPEPSTKEPANAGKSEKTAEPYYVQLRPIVVDVTEGSQVIIASGLKAGDQVVIDGVEKLKNGSKVSPKKEGGSSGGHKSSRSTDGPAKPADTAGAAAESKGGGDSKPASSGSGHHHDHGKQP